MIFFMTKKERDEKVYSKLKSQLSISNDRLKTKANDRGNTILQDSIAIIDSKSP